MVVLAIEQRERDDLVDRHDLGVAQRRREDLRGTSSNADSNRRRAAEPSRTTTGSSGEARWRTRAARRATATARSPRAPVVASSVPPVTNSQPATRSAGSRISSDRRRLHAEARRVDRRAAGLLAEERRVEARSPGRFASAAVRRRPVRRPVRRGTALDERSAQRRELAIQHGVRAVFGRGRAGRQQSSGSRRPAAVSRSAVAGRLPARQQRTGRDHRVAGRRPCRARCRSARRRGCRSGRRADCRRGCRARRRAPGSTSRPPPVRASGRRRSGRRRGCRRAGRSRARPGRPAERPGPSTGPTFTTFAPCAMPAASFCRDRPAPQFERPGDAVAALGMRVLHRALDRSTRRRPGCASRPRRAASATDARPRCAASCCPGIRTCWSDELATTIGSRGEPQPLTKS